ncbi:MAG: hypothetical protein M1817_006013 [Caeruleum heppii]|nr:MAG: hypothetical protein M1817_006013 [Caeruleum heppii]
MSASHLRLRRRTGSSKKATTVLVSGTNECPVGYQFSKHPQQDEMRVGPASDVPEGTSLYAALYVYPEAVTIQALKKDAVRIVPSLTSVASPSGSPSSFLLRTSDADLATVLQLRPDDRFLVESTEYICVKSDEGDIQVNSSPIGHGVAQERSLPAGQKSPSQQVPDQQGQKGPGVLVTRSMTDGFPPHSTNASTSQYYTGHEIKHWTPRDPPVTQDRVLDTPAMESRYKSPDKDIGTSKDVNDASEPSASASDRHTSMVSVKPSLDNHSSNNYPLTRTNTSISEAHAAAPEDGGSDIGSDRRQLTFSSEFANAMQQGQYHAVKNGEPFSLSFQSDNVSATNGPLIDKDPNATTTTYGHRTSVQTSMRGVKRKLADAAAADSLSDKTGEIKPLQSNGLPDAVSASIAAGREQNVEDELPKHDMGVALSTPNGSRTDGISSPKPAEVVVEISSTRGQLLDQARDLVSKVENLESVEAGEASAMASNKTPSNKKLKSTYATSARRSAKKQRKIPRPVKDTTDDTATDAVPTASAGGDSPVSASGRTQWTFEGESSVSSHEPKIGRRRGRPPKAPAPTRSAYDGPPPLIVFSNTTVPVVPRYKKFLKETGAKQVDTVSEMGSSVLCVGAGELKRTSKLTLSVALGKTIVTDDWIKDSYAAGHLIDTAAYLPKDAEREVQWDTTLEESIQRGRDGTRVLDGWTVFLTKALDKEVGGAIHELQQMAETAGAEQVHIGSPKALPSELPLSLVVGSERDVEGGKLQKLGWTVHSKDILSLSILRGELQHGRGEFVLKPIVSPGPQRRSGAATRAR